MSAPQQFLSKLVTQSWNIHPARGRSIVSSIVQKLLPNASRPFSERPSEDDFGDPLPTMQIIGDIAVIPLRGVLVMNVPEWAKRYGLNLTDANDIEEEADKALADPNVAMLVVDCDSPGGWSLAGDKLFDVFESANRKKPVMSWVGDGADCCSACYNAVAPSRAILAGWFATAIGSVGSFLSLMDDTEFWKGMGINWEVFRSGEYKGLLEDPLNEKQRKYLQEITDVYGARIRGNVLKYRKTIAREDLEGQWWDGLDAARHGFIGGNAKNLQAAIAKFRKLT